MSVNVKLPANLEALTKLELIKLVRDLSQQRPQMKPSSVPNRSLVQTTRRASQAEVVDLPAQKRRRVASPLQPQGRVEADTSRLTQDLNTWHLDMHKDLKAWRAKKQEERIQQRQTSLANHRAAPPEARIRGMLTTRKGFRFGRGDAVSNLNVTVPVFGETNDDGTLKKEISLVQIGEYTKPGELLLKIWTYAQPVPRKLLLAEKKKNYRTGKVTESRSSGLAKYLLRLKKTELVKEDKDGFRLSNTFKPWMLTGVPSTSAKFKPSVPGLFEKVSFRELHKQAGGIDSVK